MNPLKILTILGTRPEIIRLSFIMRRLDQHAERHVMVHTGQNFTYSLKDVFFEELGLRQPDYTLHTKPSLGSQLGMMFEQMEIILQKEKPDKVLILGDTNSAVTAVLAERMGIPVYHMEAGNRCFDLMVPEENNRRIIDAISSINMPYTRQSKDNLLREGMPVHRIVTTGNPIYEVILLYKEHIVRSEILNKLSLSTKKYFLLTAHRAENVDHPNRLYEILASANKLAEEYQLRVICSIHPRTRSKIEVIPDLIMHPLVEFHEPFGFFDFVKLEQNALCVLTDSGTVQEECCIFHVPTVTIRNSTERPETVDCGSNIVAGLRASQIVNAVKLMVQLAPDWECPQGYLDTDVSSKVVKLLLGGKVHVHE